MYAGHKRCLEVMVIRVSFCARVSQQKYRILFYHNLIIIFDVCIFVTFDIYLEYLISWHIHANFRRLCLEENMKTVLASGNTPHIVATCPHKKQKHL